MNEEIFKEHVGTFFKAVKEHTLLIVIDSKSKEDKAVFQLVYFDKENKIYRSFYGMLDELGFKHTKDNRFITHCAGRYSLFILDNIGQELKKKGVNLPEWWYKEIQNQNVI
jgi:hypothetical protein